LYRESLESVLTLAERLRELLMDGSVWRMRDLVARGITASTVRREVDAGTVEAVSRGTYRRAGAPHVAGGTIAEALARMPRGVACLFSAAELHGLGDVSTAKVWIAIPNHCKPPRLAWPPVRPVRWRGTLPFEVGVEERTICGVRVRVTDPARTVVDMLRMRSTVGEDRALECLREYADGGGSLPTLRDLAERFGITPGMAAFINGFMHGRGSS
jgi:predicted transcriptional regulator of viral defense system